MFPNILYEEESVRLFKQDLCKQTHFHSQRAKDKLLTVSALSLLLSLCLLHDKEAQQEGGQHVFSTCMPC